MNSVNSFHSFSTGEFGLIARHFTRARPPRHATLGVGDDCALLQPLPGEQLAISTDMLVAGRHFFADADPRLLGHKALAVNLSDLAACGAQPLGFTLALALPQQDDTWLAAFAGGLFALADAHQCDLIGGDTTRGALNLCLAVFGSVPQAQALLRSGARAGDDIWVSYSGSDAAGGGLGDARLALHLLLHQSGQPLPAANAAQLSRLDAAIRTCLLQATRQRLDAPMPRVALGMALRGVASACADISDGLAGDLGHILAASDVGATLWAAGDAADDGLRHATSAALRSLGETVACGYALAGGDDYELVFTAPPSQQYAVRQVAAQAGTRVCRTGQIEHTPGLRWRDAQGRTTAVAATAFDHFAA